MRAQAPLLAFCAVAAAVRAEEPPDYFANLRDKTFVEVDQSYLVKGKSALPESPALFRIRHFFLRVKAGTGDSERRWWPMRSLFLIEAASGNRFVAEFTADSGDLEHRDIAKAWTRLSGSSRGLAVESWSISDPHEEDSSNADEPGSHPEAACAGTRYRFIGGGLEIGGVYLRDARTRTASVALAEIRDATFSADEVRELDRLRSLEIPRLGGGTGTQVAIPSGVRLAWSFLFMEKPPIQSDKQDLVLVPDPGPPGNLAPWRMLTYLPQDLPPFPPLPPEGGVK